MSYLNDMMAVRNGPGHRVSERAMSRLTFAYEVALGQDR